MAKLSKEQVEHIAKLARLEFTEEEKVKFQDQLSSILDYVEKLDEVDTTSVKPMSHVLDLENVTRDDVVCESMGSRDILLQDMPARDGDLLKVPPIFEQGPKI